MAPYTRNMNQTATYWAPLGSDGFGGKTYDEPVTIACRWQDKADRIRTPSGDEYVSASVVYVDRALAVDGMLALGEHQGTPAEAGASAIVQKGSSPNLAATEELNKVWL